MKTRDYLQFLQRPHRLVILALLLAASQVLVVVGLGVSVRTMFDKALPGQDFRMAGWLCVALLGLYLLDIAVNSLAVVRINRLIQEGMVRLRRHLADHAFRLPRAYYSQADLGGLHVDWVQETGRLEQLTQVAMTVLLPHTVSALTVSVVMLVLNVWLSLVCWMVMALGWIAVTVLRPRVGRAVKASHEAIRQYSKKVLFILHMMDLIRIRNAEDTVRHDHAEAASESRGRTQDLVRARMAYNAVLRIMVSVMMVSLLLVGSYLVLIAKSLTLGELLAFFAVAALLRNALNQILTQIPHLLDGTEALRRISRFLEVEDRVPYTGTRRPEGIVPVRMDGVAFGYAGGPLLFEGLDLGLEPGDTLVLSGPSGAGKSTLGFLLLGWFRPSRGRLRAAGIPYDELDMGGLRRRTGVVLQDPWLFSGTVRENLLFGIEPQPARALDAALSWSEADEFVQALPRGLDTPVGERGVRLSGGQKQRLAIARALLGPIELLILDEPDNHLEPGYLLRLMARLQEGAPEVAAVIISHAPGQLAAHHPWLRLEGADGRWSYVQPDHRSAPAASVSLADPPPSGR